MSGHPLSSGRLSAQESLPALHLSHHIASLGCLVPFSSVATSRPLLAIQCLQILMKNLANTQDRPWIGIEYILQCFPLFILILWIFLKLMSPGAFHQRKCHRSNSNSFFLEKYFTIIFNWIKWRRKFWDN